jgi:hypothetical protein
MDIRYILGHACIHAQYDYICKYYQDNVGTWSKYQKSVDDSFLYVQYTNMKLGMHMPRSYTMDTYRILIILTHACGCFSSWRYFISLCKRYQYTQGRVCERFNIVYLHLASTTVLYTSNLTKILTVS